MTWRTARSLDTLLEQVNDQAPGRSKISDGSVSSDAHRQQNPDSDHDPDAKGIVHARDFTDDPGAGFDASAFADRLLKAQDARLKYVISDGRIGSGPSGRQPGVWRPYSGENAHRKHCHVSVVSGPKADLTAPWVIGPVTASVKPAPKETPVSVLVIVRKPESVWEVTPSTQTRKRVKATILELLPEGERARLQVLDDEKALAEYRVVS